MDARFPRCPEIAAGQNRKHQAYFAASAMEEADYGTTEMEDQNFSALGNFGSEFFGLSVLELDGVLNEEGTIGIANQ